MSSTTTSKPATKSGLRIKSRVKAGSEIIVTKDLDISSRSNHNQTAKGLRVKSRVKAGSLNFTKITFSYSNHNQAAKGLRVKSAVKAGRVTLTDVLVSS